MPPRDTVAFDKLTENDEVLAYLPLAWVGDHYLNYAQALVAGFCMACPESAETAMRGSEGDRPDLLFRAAARVRAPAHARDDPHGGRRPRSSGSMFHYFIGVARRCGETILNGQPVPLDGPAALRARRSPGLCAAQERARLLARARRLHRGRGDRAEICSRSIARSA